MKKKFLSLLLALMTVAPLAACELPFGNSNGSGNNDADNGVSVNGSVSANGSVTDSSLEDSSVTVTPVERVDYAATLKLDMDSATKKLTFTPDSKTGKISYTHIDGDTTHFSVAKSIDESGTIKARYLGVDTPESTGDIEEWGKAASKFTKTKLASATKIILESDADNQWTQDSNGRYLTWVWYLAEGATEYRLLNLELVQEGLAAPSFDCRYGNFCMLANTQAQALSLHIYSGEKDPDFYYGTAIKTTLKEVRSNLDEYVGKRIAVHGIVTIRSDAGSIYVQEYDEEDDRAYGLPVYYGMNNKQYDPILAPGNEVRIVGEVTNSETFGYQISGLFYDFMDPDNEESIKDFSAGNPIEFPEITVDDFVANDYALAKDLLYGTVSVKNLTVKSVYTTQDGDSAGAMTLTCKDSDGTEIKIRTGVLRNADSTIITADKYQGKTITVKGIAEEYTYTDYDTNLPVTTYQIDVFSSIHITIQE